MPAGEFEKANEPIELTLVNHFRSLSRKTLENLRAISPNSGSIGQKDIFQSLARWVKDFRLTDVHGNVVHDLIC